jgi:hypothetical protein
VKREYDDPTEGISSVSSQVCVVVSAQQFRSMAAGGRSADIIVVLDHRRDIPYPRAAAIQPDVRLTLSLSPTADDDAVGGRWWPRTRDPATELPALANVVADRLGVVRRISVNADAWDSWPHQLRIIGGPRVRLDWCTGDAHTIRLTSGASHLVLLAIPPDTPTILALACLATAARDMTPPDRVGAAATIIT